jgi:hypothetical protein
MILLNLMFSDLIESHVFIFPSGLFLSIIVSNY